MTNMPPNAPDIIGQLPHRRQEAWKWSDLRGRTREDAGGLTSAMTPDIFVPEDVRYSQGGGHRGSSPMAALAAHFAPESHNFYVPAGAKPQQPVELSRLTRGHASFAIMVDKGAALTLVERYSGAENGFANSDIQIHLAEGARLTRILIQDDPETMVRVALCCIAADRNAAIEQYTLSFGAALSRLETQIIAAGENVKAAINGAYLLGGDRHCDMTSLCRLQDEHAHIRQNVKGVIAGRARGVFQGKFHVERAAQHTDAQMRHDALMLSGRAEVRAKPELEIYADDVACAHGNTIGALDEAALFYMRQRGLPLSQAKAVLTRAFVAGAFDALDEANFKAEIFAAIDSWLEHHHG